MLISTELVSYFSRRLFYHNDRIVIISDEITGYFFRININKFTNIVDGNFICDLKAWAR